jgi:phospholipid/cholesterol/gamma-HCH transport system permease protein
VSEHQFRQKSHDVFEQTILRSVVPLQYAGGNARQFLEFLGKLARLCIQFFKELRVRPFEWKEFRTQCEQIGLNSLPIALFSLLFVGLIFAFQFASAFKRFGAMNYVGRVNALSMLRELGPVFTSLVVGGRVGAGMAAELGSMKVTEQIDAIRALGASPYKKLLVPRVVAGTVMMPLLVVLATFVGMFASMMIVWIEFGVSPLQFYKDGMRFLEFADFWSGFGKPFVFGFFIAIIGCHHGFTCGQGTASVGRATTQAVVSVSLMVVLVDFILTRFFAIFYH